QPGWSALTRSEREIVRLVAKGLTNREIGEQLFSSPRTVESHLTRVFGKVGLSSRRDLAREALRRGL
ncbi:MAG: response regulator transcription factor, partial [Candidatus Dormibacteria bacterium]